MALLEVARSGYGFRVGHRTDDHSDRDDPADSVAFFTGTGDDDGAATDSEIV